MTDEAHKFGKLTAIHCVFKEADGSDRFRPEVAERLGRQGAFINPTLHVGRSRIWALQLKREREGRLTPEEQARLDEMQRQFELRLEDCRRLIEMGLKVITGSDSSWGDYKLGNMVYETECLLMAGITPMKGVLSVTSEAAKALGMADKVGTLEPGKLADILVVDGSPAEDIRALWNVSDFFFGGQRIGRGSADSLTSIRQPRPDKQEHYNHRDRGGYGGKRERTRQGGAS